MRRVLRPASGHDPGGRGLDLLAVRGAGREADVSLTPDRLVELEATAREAADRWPAEVNPDELLELVALARKGLAVERALKSNWCETGHRFETIVTCVVCGEDKT